MFTGVIVPRQTNEVIYILAEALPRFPKGIQGYVKRYFQEVSFLGHVYYTALLVISYDYGKNRDVRGVAPKFLENYSHFREGLKDGVSPYSWLQERLEDKVQQEIVLTRHSWELDSSKENND